MSYIEKKYCSCLSKLRGARPKGAYAICTKSVYHTRGLKRNKIVRCYKHKNLTELRMYAKSKGIKLTKNGTYLNKASLLKKIDLYYH